MTVLARSASTVDEISIGPVTELADINPACPLIGLERDSSVSFIPMSDASESGQWLGRQTRKLYEVSSGYTSFREGDVLFAKITPCMENGKGCHALGLVNGVGFGSTEFHVLRAKPNTDARFLYHWLQSDVLRLAAEAMMTGSAGQRRVPSEFFGRLPIPLLPLDEQRRIAEILDTADLAIGQTETLISKLEQMKTGLMHDLLTRGLDERGHLRDPDAHPEQFKNSSLGRIPREWEIEELRDVVDSKRPIVYGILMPGYGYPNGIPVVKVKDILNGIIDTSDLLLTSPEIESEYSRSRLRAGDLLFTIRGTVGRTAFVQPDLEGANITQDTARVAVTKADPHFVAHYLEMPQPQSFVDANTLGVAVRGINLGELRRFPLALPPRSEQSRIAEILDAHDARIRAEEAYRDKLKLQKKGLMDDLLTGRVRVKTVQEVSS